MDLMRDPQLFGCGRLPFLVLLGGVPLLIVLRRAAAQDPLWFAVRGRAMKYPRHMPDVLPDPSLPRHPPFVSYMDPPARETVILAWAGVTGVMFLHAGLVWWLFGALAGGLTFMGLMALVCLWVITLPKDPADDPWRKEIDRKP